MNDEFTDHVEQVNGAKICKQSDDCNENVPQARVRDVDTFANGCSSNGTSSNAQNGANQNDLNSVKCTNCLTTAETEKNLQNGHRSCTTTAQICNSSSSEDDDDEQCIYTYKGVENGADLPDSFVNLGMNVLNGQNRSSLCSSPDMDYLEMDFDPGPSNDQDSDSDNGLQVPQKNVTSKTATDAQTSAKIEALKCDENYNSCSQLNANVLPSVSSSSPSHDELDLPQPCCSKSLNANRHVEENETIYEYDTEDAKDEQLQDRNENWFRDVHFQKLSEDSDPEEMTFIPRTILRESYENREIDVNSLSDVSLLGSEHEDMLISYDDLLPVDPSFSISAIMNVLKLLRIPHLDVENRETFVSLLRHKQIPENVPLVEYLYMRAVQNANENDLANFSSNLFDKKLYSRFFSTYPKLGINLLEWLNTWMKKGAVPVVTRNIQERGLQSTKNIVHNLWRHNVVYRIESSYIYLANPIERVAEYVLRSQLSQAPLVYVKRKSVLKRWHSKVDLRTLLKANNNRWYNENVLGQVATIVREHNAGSKMTQYVRIPSNCNCGITLFAPSENVSLCKQVEDAVELPLIQC